jgi:hypothetical protein
MPEQQPQPKWRIVDNPHVPEVYANKFVSATFDGGALVITMGTSRVSTEPAGQPQGNQQTLPVHVTARLAVSAQAAVELVNAVNSVLGAVAKAAAAQQQQAPQPKPS